MKGKRGKEGEKEEGRGRGKRGERENERKWVLEEGLSTCGALAPRGA